MLKYISSKLGIDSHIGNTLVLRAWNIIAGGIVIILIPLKLSPAEQGYYYTIMSLVSVQIFFELGFNYVISQIVAHETPKLYSQGAECDKARKKISQILALSKKWYLVSSSAFFLIALIIGIKFFHIDLTKIDILVTWAGALLFTSINLYISPQLAITEGLGRVDEIAKLRLRQSVSGYCTMWILLIFNLGLPSLVCISLFAAVMAILWSKNNTVLTNFKKDNDASDDVKLIDWKTDILPFQWRIALSWISGYLIFQLFNPIIFMHQGVEEAGKIGLSLSIFNTILTLSMSWVNAKSPRFGFLISEGSAQELNKLFKKVTFSSAACNVLLSTLFICFVYILSIYVPAITDRILPYEDLWILLVCNMANQIIFSSALYMRAFKKEPMMINSIVSGIIVVSLLFYFSKISTSAALLSYLFVTLAISLPWTLALLKKFYMKV